MCQLKASVELCRVLVTTFAIVTLLPVRIFQRQLFRMGRFCHGFRLFMANNRTAKMLETGALPVRCPETKANICPPAA